VRNSKTFPVLLIFLALTVRLLFLAFFHHQVYSGPSTQFEQAFVALNILEGHGPKTFKEPPPVVDPSNPTRILDPEHYVVPSPELLPYVKEVTGYSFFLAFLWLITGTKLWIFAQLAQILLDVLAGWGLYFLAKKFFGQKAAYFALLVFAFLFFEARTNVVPYKDIFLFYFMLLIAIFSGPIFLQRRKSFFWFFLVCLFTGLGFYFMTTILLYPIFLTAVLLGLKRIQFRVAASFFLIAVVVVGALIFPYANYVRNHRNDPGVAQPLFWYRFWLGTKVQAFYSTQEERFEDYFKERMKASGLTLEELCKQEFFDYVRTHPFQYAAQTLKKLCYGTFLVYANAGDCTYPNSWSYFKSLHPGARFLDYARNFPLRILGMALGTITISILFPLSLIAVFLLGREKRGAEAFFFFQIPLYFILLHMFFHYEARYLMGTLPGYLPLVGYLLSKIKLPWAKI
jgi:hypothetical protein